MKNQGTVHIGTSGWHYDHWRGVFYPEKTATQQMLGYYSRHFHTVEINNSFYQLPQKNTLAGWRDEAPDGFLFSVKGSRYITHMKKLKDPDQSVPPLMEAAVVLGDKLGPILFQLPPRWHVNLERLEDFLRRLPRDFRYAFEFRDASWFADETYQILSQHQAAFCIYHLAGELSPRAVTTDFVYVRLHGPDGAYQGQYDTQTLAGWAGAFSTWCRQGRTVFCYFDNDQNGYAAQDALELKNMLATDAGEG